MLLTYKAQYSYWNGTSLQTPRTVFPVGFLKTFFLEVELTGDHSDQSLWIESFSFDGDNPFPFFK